MSTLNEYTLLQSYDSTELMRSVRYHMDDGWGLLGGVAMAAAGGTSYRYTQAMVKRVEMIEPIGPVEFRVTAANAMGHTATDGTAFTIDEPPPIPERVQRREAGWNAALGEPRDPYEQRVAAEADAELSGTGFLVDGKRVDPSRVQMIHWRKKYVPPKREVTDADLDRALEASNKNTVPAYPAWPEKWKVIERSKLREALAALADGVVPPNVGLEHAP